jgi:hypothetical protein
MLTTVYVLALLAAPPPQPTPYIPRGTSAPGHPVDVDALIGLLVIVALAAVCLVLVPLVRRPRRGAGEIHAARLFEREVHGLQASITAPAAGTAPAPAPAAGVCGNAPFRRGDLGTDLRCTLAMDGHPEDYHEAWSPAGEFVESWPVVSDRANR